MAVLSFEEYKKQLQEGKKPESLYVSKPTVTSGADTESTAAEPVKAAEPDKSGVKTWSKGGSTYVTDRSTGKTTQTFSALDYFLGLGSQGEELRKMTRLADQQAAKEKGIKPSHESLSLDLGQMYRGTVENIGAAYSSAVATLANTAGAIAAGDNNYEPEEDSFIWKLVESAEGKTGYAESNLENAKEGRGAVGRFAMDVGSAGLELAVDQALNFIVPGSGMAAMGVRSFGRKSEASREAGESVSTQVIKGSIAAATAVATERMSEIGGLKTGKPGYLDRAWGKVSNVMESKTGSKILGRVVTGFGSEALEEVIESVINPIAQRAFGAFGLLGEDEADAFESIGQIAYEGLVGGTLGALGAVGNVEYNGAKESGETAAPNITADELARSCENATNLAIDQHIAKAKAKANEQAEITQPITTAEGTTAGGNPSVSLRSTAPITQESQTPQSPTATAPLRVEPINVKQEAQSQAAETAQEAQRATAWAETPPTTQNDVTGALNALNLFEEGNVASTDYDTQSRESLMFSEAPQEAVQNTDSFGAITANDDFQNRDFNDVGNQKIKAYMYENPEVKPFFQLEAEAMLNDLKNSVKGERFYNSQLAYESGNEYGWTGNKRFVSDDIAVLLDYGYSYEEIEKGLKAIIEDDGRENNACSKRIEFLLNDRLMDGYTDWQSNEFVPPNQEYRNMILEKQINAYSKEAFEEYLKNAERYAPKEAKINSNGQLNRQAETTAREQGAGVQREARETEGADAVRGFSKNVATDSAMEAELREEKKNNPDLYKRLGNKETLEKAESIFVQGLDYARSELERAIGAAQSGQKLPIEMVPLSRMVANALTRRGELAAASKIISDVGAELTYGGELGQAGAILRNADPITVLNTLQKSLDRINEEAVRSKKNNKSADNQPVSGKELQNAVSDAAKGIQSNEAVKNAVDSAVNESGEIQKIHEKAAKNTAEKLASDMEKEIPADDAAKAIRNAVKSAAISRTKPPKAVDRQTQIINSAKKFALEKLPPRKRSAQRTAVDVLSDYVQNSELFAEAWEKAQSLLREDTDFAEQPGAMREADNFINEGIEVNAKLRAERTQSIFRRAIVEEAIKAGESKETIRGQYALGLSVEEISKRISDRLIKLTSADGEIAETIRSAAYDYAEEIINGDKLSTEQRNEALVKRTVRDIGESFRSMAIKGNTEKTSVMEAVGDIVAYDMALDPSTAEHIAVTVYEEYSRLLQESMNREIERRFGDRNPAKAKALKEQIREAINIGAFDSLYAEKAAGSLTEKALKELGITINQAALGNSAERTSIRNAVISLFTKNYGLSTEKAAEIADLVTSQFDNMVGQAADKLLERRFGDKPKTKQEKATEVEKLIEAVNLGAFDTDYAEAAAKKLFGLDKISAKNWTAELTPEEIQQIANTDFSQDGAFEAVQHQIAVRLGREMPATWAEKLREIRKVGMLANPKTQIKNRWGNIPLKYERKMAEKLSGGLQELAVKAGIMSEKEQTRTLRVSKESKDLAKSVYENNIDRINRKGNKGELRGLLKDTRTYFNKGLLQKGIEKATGHQLNDAALDYVRRFTYECLEKGDAPFVKSAFIDSLAQYCEAQGIKSEADVTETAISYAIDQAMAATFKDASALANLLNGIKDKAGIAGQALDVLLPFTTTPINIAKEFGKYSPLGYLQLLNAKGKGTAEVIDIISRATTGSAVVAIGALLRGLGFITGAADDDKDKAAADKAAGISPYSFGGKYSYEWMQPTGSALAMGASIYDAAKDGGSLIETISNGIISAGDAYLEQSFYKDIIDLFQGYGSPTENMIRELLTGTASQFIPTIVGATARTIDPTVRTSYSGGNIIDDILAQAKVKTPGKSKSAPASVNVRGEEIQRGNLLERILDNFIFPWTTNRNGGEENAVDEAIDEVYADTADKTIFRQVSPYKVDYGGETYKMTGEEREQFQKTQGQVHDDILQQIIDGTLWQEMDNDAKVKTMQLANEYALDAAKRELVEARGDEYSSDWDDEAVLPDVGNYLAAKTTLKAAQDSKDYTLLDALVDTVTEQQKSVQEKLNKDFSMLDELIYGKQHGVDAETIYTAKTEADANGNGKISQDELWYYLGLQKNMPARTKSVLWDILTTGKTGYSEYAEKQK